MKVAVKLSGVSTSHAKRCMEMCAQADFAPSEILSITRTTFVACNGDSRLYLNVSPCEWTREPSLWYRKLKTDADKAIALWRHLPPGQVVMFAIKASPAS